MVAQRREAYSQYAFRSVLFGPKSKVRRTIRTIRYGTLCTKYASHNPGSSLVSMCFPVAKVAKQSDRTSFFCRQHLAICRVLISYFISHWRTGYPPQPVFLASRGVRTVLRRNRTVPYYTYSTPYCVFSLEMIRFGRRTLNTVRASVYKG